jgi:hypothetical protein
MGAMAGRLNHGGAVNAIGNSAAEENLGADVNALGWQAAQFNSGEKVNALGPKAARYNNGSQVVAIGDSALVGSLSISEGSGNIGIGYRAGKNIGTGTNNIAIGYDAQFIDGNAANQINIGNNIIRNEFGVIQLKDLIQLTPTTTPNPAVAGMIFFDSADGNKLKAYDGTGWHELW